MGLLKRRCMSCTTNTAELCLRGRFIEYAWCAVCLDEFNRLVASVTSDDPRFSFPVDTPKPSDEEVTDGTE